MILATESTENVNFMNLSYVHGDESVQYLLVLERCHIKMYRPVFRSCLWGISELRGTFWSHIWSLREIWPSWAQLTEACSAGAKWPGTAGPTWREREPASIWQLPPTLRLHFVSADVMNSVPRSILSSHLFYLTLSLSLIRFLSSVFPVRG